MWSYVAVSLISLLVGLVAGGLFWRRRAYQLHFWWMQNFNHAVNSSVAEFFGGQIPDKVIPIKIVPPGDGGKVN